MLKIKQEVDLKELEKFGMEFKTNFYKEKECYVFYVKDQLFGNLFVRLSINVYTRQIRPSTCKEAFDLLFDLIQAGLVEKVEEQK